jgi:hypothetical protein
LGVAYSPDEAIVTMDSNSLRFWNPSDGKGIDTYPLDALKIATPFGRIQWSPTGEWIAIGSQDKTPRRIVSRKQRDNLGLLPDDRLNKFGRRLIIGFEPQLAVHNGKNHFLLP